MRWPILILALLPLPGQAAPAGSGQSDVLCKRQVETGRLAYYKRVCLSRSEWQRLEGRGNEPAPGLRPDLQRFFVQVQLRPDLMR
jgi:hypothetical protein